MLVLVTVCLVIWICVLRYRRARLLESRAHPLPPAYPGYLPIIGHTHLLLTDFSNLWLKVKDMFQYSLRQGGVIYGKFGPDIYYILTDPEDNYLVANTCLEKHFLHDFGKCILGEGLVTGSGDHWRRHRELLRPNFSLSIVNSFLEVFNSQSRAFLSDLECNVGKEQFHATKYVKQLALETSYMTTFGKAAGKEFYPKYMKAIEELLGLMVLRFQKFWLQSDLIYKLLGGKKHESELVKTANELTNEILQTKKSFLNGTNDRAYVAYQPVIDLMLEQNSRHNFTDQEITEELHTNVAAAFETTAHSLETILIMIGSFPKVQEKIYEEITQVLGTHEDVHKDDVRKLVYTEAVIRESLRVLPTVTVTLRYVDRDVKLKNYTLRAGSQCVISHYSSLQHPTWWPDADIFRPERWLDTTTLPPKFVRDATFGVGKRSCLGKTYALTSMKVTIAHMVRKYIITADHTKLRLKMDITMKAVSGHEISLQRRVT